MGCACSDEVGHGIAVLTGTSVLASNLSSKSWQSWPPSWPLVQVRLFSLFLFYLYPPSAFSLRLISQYNPHPPLQITTLFQYGLELDPQQEAQLGSHTRKPWSRFVNADNQHLATPEAIDFIDKLLRYDHQERITSQDALSHHYFNPIRNMSAGGVGAGTTGGGRGAV